MTLAVKFATFTEVNKRSWEGEMHREIARHFRDYCKWFHLVPSNKRASDIALMSDDKTTFSRQGKPTTIGKAILVSGWDWTTNETVPEDLWD